MNSDSLLSFINSLISYPFVERVILFGSRARKDYSSRSDIDIAVDCPTATFENWTNVLEAIDEARTLLKIDCIRLDKLEPKDPLRTNILEQGHILFDRREQYMDKLLWKDYFDSLGDAINRLQEVLDHPNIEESDIIRDAAIQRFEFAIEMFWKVLRKFLSYEKIEASTPRDVLKSSYQYGLIDHQMEWIQMLDDRNRTSHVYKESESKEIFERIKKYGPLMQGAYQALKLRFDSM